MPDAWEWIGNTVDGVMDADGGRKIILWNSAAERILGFRAQEALRRPSYQIFGRKGDSSGRLICQEGCQGRALGKRSELGPAHDVLTYAKDGQEIWLNVTTIVAPTRRRDFAVIHLFRDAGQKKEYGATHPAFSLRRGQAPFEPCPDRAGAFSTGCFS